jgi:anion-transporting  ArsA/GET3 family ATPase
MISDNIVRDSKLIVCVGSGGVGKTSVSASLAVRGAMLGRRVLVLTIDPAKRLANSLGLSDIGNKEHRVELDGRFSGELFAMMLDTAQTFDSLIDKVAPDDATRDAIRGNRIYQTLSNHFSGSQEYMASEALYDLVESGRFDLVVLDTPPAKNALNFFEASSKLARFLDPKVIKWFLLPYRERKGLRRLMMGSSMLMFKLLSAIFGKDFLSEFSEFLINFEKLYDGFQTRHHAVHELLREKETTRFVTVCAATEASMEVSRYFIEELRTRDLPLAGIVVNKMLSTVELDPAEMGQLKLDLASLEGGFDREELLEKLSQSHTEMRQQSEIEQRLFSELRQSTSESLGGGFIAKTPCIRGEVHDIGALVTLANHLFGTLEDQK